MKEFVIEVLMVEAGKRPHKEIVFNDLEDFKIIVNECTPFPAEAEIVKLEESVVFIRNEEGFLLGLEGNRQIGDEIIAGTFFVAGIDDDGEIMSLPDDKSEKYRKRFWKIEKYTDKEVFLIFKCQGTSPCLIILNVAKEMTKRMI